MQAFAENDQMIESKRKMLYHQVNFQLVPDAAVESGQIEMSRVKSFNDGSHGFWSGQTVISAIPINVSIQCKGSRITKEGYRIDTIKV